MLYVGELAYYASIMLDASHAYYVQIMLACRVVYTQLISTSLWGLLSAAIYVYICTMYTCTHMHFTVLLLEQTGTPQLHDRWLCQMI